MSPFEWCYLILAVVTELIAVAILIRELGPTERRHAKKMLMLADLERARDAAGQARQAYFAAAQDRPGPAGDTG